jgi:hypothetical protein
MTPEDVVAMSLVNDGSSKRTFPDGDWPLRDSETD